MVVRYNSGMESLHGKVIVMFPEKDVYSYEHLYKNYLLFNRIFIREDIFKETNTIDIVKKLALIAACKEYTFCLLTSHPRNAKNILQKITETKLPLLQSETEQWRDQLMRENLVDNTSLAINEWPIPNLHLGVVVRNEDSKAHIEELMQCDVSQRYLHAIPQTKIDLSYLGRVCNSAGNVNYPAYRVDSKSPVVRPLEPNVDGYEWFHLSDYQFYILKGIDYACVPYDFRMAVEKPQASIEKVDAWKYFCDQMQSSNISMYDINNKYVTELPPETANDTDEDNKIHIHLKHIPIAEWPDNYQQALIEACTIAQKLHLNFDSLSSDTFALLSEILQDIEE